MKNLLKKIHLIQKRVRAVSKDEDTKSHYNPNGYKYVSGDKIIGIVRPLMDEFGIILKSEVVDVKNETQEYLTAKGPKKEVLTSIVMRMTWIDTETGESMECMWAGNGMNNWDKGFGSAVTYGIRYFLLKQFLVSTDEDDVDAIIRPDGGEKASETPAKNDSGKEKDLKPWLEEGSEAWTKVVAYVGKGGDIASVYNKYRVNKETEAKLKSLNTAVQAIDKAINK